MLYRQFFDDKLAKYSYLIDCSVTGEALVIDPERDIERYVEAARAEGLEIVALGAVPQSTVGYELEHNASIDPSETEDRFVDFILSGQLDPPIYFARMKRVNREGPALPGSFPEPKEIRRDQIDALAGTSEVAVIDTRPAEAFMHEHLPGALLAPLDRSFPTVAGSFVEEGMPLYLIVEEGRLREAVIDLIRIGLDEIIGYIPPATLREYFETGGKIETSEAIDFSTAEARQAAGSAQILDVQTTSEFESGHLQGAENIPHTRLFLEKDRFSNDQTWMVHCRSGARAAVAAAFLQRLGHEVRYVDERRDDYLASGGVLTGTDASPALAYGDR